MQKEVVDRIVDELSNMYSDLNDLYFICENVYDKELIEDLSRRVYWLFLTFNNYRKGIQYEDDTTKYTNR